MRQLFALVFMPTSENKTHTIGGRRMSTSVGTVKELLHKKTIISEDFLLTALLQAKVETGTTATFSKKPEDESQSI
jgi:hypothetical protein